MAVFRLTMHGLAIAGPAANRPKNPEAGCYYLASDTGILYLYDGTDWIEFASGAAASTNTADTLVKRDASGSFAGEIITGTHLETDTSTAPQIAAGPAAGTTPTTLTISGTDPICTVTMEPGSGQTSGAYFTVTYQKPFAKVPAVVPIPQNQVTAQQSGGSNIAPYVSNVTPEGFSLHSGGTFLSSMALYSWTFLSIG